MKGRAEAQGCGFPPRRCNCLFRGPPSRTGVRLNLRSGAFLTGGEKDPEEDRCLQSVLPWRQEPEV